MCGRQRSDRFASFALAAALVLGAGCLEAMPDSAVGAFPGKNGRIAFASDRLTGPGVDNPEGDREIFTMNPDGTGLRQLTKNATIDMQPAWSRDGTRIAFVKDRDGNYEVYTMGADGANQANRTENGAEDTAPDWRPRPR